MKIVGVERVDYKSRRSGNQVTGYTIHCTGTESRDLKVGMVVKDFYFKDALFVPFFDKFGGVYDKLLGLEIDVGYDEYKNPKTITVLGGGK